MRAGRRIWYMALCLSLLLLTACSGTTEPVAPEPTTPTTAADGGGTEPEKALTFTLAYSRSDSLDPFKMTSRVNRELSGLLYEGLTAPDESMHAQNVLAESVQTVGTTVTVTLRADAVFSDGSAVTAADVVTSFEAAREAEAYRELLRGVDSAKAAKDDARTVTFTWKEPESYAAACLSFPVIRTRADGTVLGSGPFVFESTPRLVANPHAPAGSVTEVRLLDLVDDDSLAKGLELGNLTYFFSNLADGTVPRVNAATAAVPLNCLVFLGVNSAHSSMANAETRAALSLALDRARVADGAFGGYAEAATTVFPPAFVSGETVTALAADADRDAAKAKLAAQGYTTPDTAVTTAARSGKKPTTLSLVLLVNGDNGFKSAMAELVRDQLQAVGVSVTVQSLSFSDYQSALKRGQYDLYIGEVRLGTNMDLSPLLTKGGAAAYGVAGDSAAAASYAAFRAGQASLADFTAAFAADLPLIPVCWRSGMAAYNRALTKVTPTAYSVYAGLQNWQSGN